MQLSTKQVISLVLSTALFTLVFSGTLTGKIPNVLLRIHPFPEIEFQLGGPGSTPVKAPPHPKAGKNKPPHGSGRAPSSI